MRWPLVRLIAGKEFRDLVRDRRTVLLILVLPALLYPLFGGAGLVFALSQAAQNVTVGVVNAGALPPPGTPAALLTAEGRFPEAFDTAKEKLTPLTVAPLDGDPQEALRTRAVDAVLVLPATLRDDLADPKRKVAVRVLEREGDDKSKAAARRVSGVVRAWEAELRRERFVKAGLPRDFDRVVDLEDPQSDKPKGKLAADELRDTFSKVFPFILMMWLVASAIQPAVDMTAGEKERGTMETLLISPAERSEIVVGKFLATTAFAYASVLWNVLWLTGGALIIQTVLGFPVVSLPGLVGCVVLGVPQAMLFSAVCLALGVYAKSTKEGQYYLMPLILVTMPLALGSMLPGAELSPTNCWVPVTGPMLLQAKLLSVGDDSVPWAYIAPVLASSVLWVSLALWFAVRQFQSESVLFREAAPKTSPFARWLGRKPAATP